MPPGSRDDRHRPHPRHILSKTGHHGHVNHPSAQHSHPCPPPTNINRVGCAAQHSGDLVFFFKFWNLFDMERKKKLSLWPVKLLYPQWLRMHALVIMLQLLRPTVIVFIAEQSRLSTKNHKYFVCLFFSPAGCCSHWTWLGVPGNRTQTQCWGPAVRDRCVCCVLFRML